VTIYDVGTLADGRAYISMRLLDGSNLADVIATRAPLPPAEAASFIRQLADALDYMHRSGLIHRDVKPSNVIVGPGNWLTLTDFGIARAMEAARLTLPGMALGTPRYMAPEQVRGEDVGIATDVYALGVIAYELLAGRPPFEADGTALMYQIVHEQPPALGTLNGTLSLEISGVLHRALAKSPADRWESAGAFAQALAAAIPGEPDATIAAPTAGPTETVTQMPPIRADSPPAPPASDQTVVTRPAYGGTVPPAAPATSTQRPTPPAPPVIPPSTTPGTPPAGTPASPPEQVQKRSGVPVLAVVGGLIALLVLAAGAFLLTRQGGGATGTVLTGSSAEPTGGSGAPSSPLRIIAPADGSGIIAPVTVSVEVPGYPIKPPTLGDPSAYHLHYFIDIDPSTLPRGVPIPTGQGNIIHSAETTITIDSPLSVGEHTIWAVLTKNDHVSLSPPITAKTTFRVLRSLEDARGLDQTPIVFNSIVGSPGHLQVFVLDRPGATPRQLTSGNSDNVRPAFSPDGSQIVFRSNRDGGKWRLYLMNANGTNQRALTRPDGSTIEGDDPAWSPDGTRIAYHVFKDGGEQIHVVNVSSGEVQQLTRSTNNNVSPTWSPDGTKIAFQSDRAGSWQIFIMDADGRNQTQLTSGQTNHHYPAWSPDGRYIAFSAFENNTYKIFSIGTSGQEQKRLTDGGGDSGDQNPSWTPNGKHIVFESTRASSEHRLFAVEVATGAIQQLTSGRPQDLAPRFPAR
jgi:serine/threonine-protein kinase